MITIHIPDELYERITGKLVDLDVPELLITYLTEIDRTYEEKPLVLDDEKPDKTTHLFWLARDNIFAANGEWVSWGTIRPAYRDRERYEGRVWKMLTDDPTLVTEETNFGSRVRRRVRAPKNSALVVDSAKLERLFRLALDKVSAKNGDWSLWNGLRPVWRDRAVYEEALWQKLSRHPDLEIGTNWNLDRQVRTRN